MCMKPMELNIIEAVPGMEITLYDTSVKCGKGEPEKDSRIRFLEYGYGIINGRDLLKWGLERLAHKVKK